MAIAFDAAASGVTDQASLTYAHTCTGSNLILFVSSYSVGDVVSGITYNGVAMTKIGSSVQTTGTTNYSCMFYLVNPATGAHNVVVSTALGSTYSSAASYTGVKQTDQPDATANATTASTPLTLTNTVVANNCWLISMVGCSGGQTASTGVTLRVSPGTAAIGDSNGTVTIGSQNMVWILGSGIAGSGIIVSFGEKI